MVIRSSAVSVYITHMRVVVVGGKSVSSQILSNAKRRARGGRDKYRMRLRGGEEARERVYMREREEEAGGGGLAS